MQLGVHGIDLCQHLFGPITEVMAISQNLKPKRRLNNDRTVQSSLEDNVLAGYQFAAGHSGSHELSFTEVAGYDCFRLEVYFENTTVWLRTGKALAIVAKGTQGNTPLWGAIDLPDEALGMAHHRHWLEIIREQAPVDDTPEVGLSTTVVAENIYRAASNSARVKIPA
jgi:predicted dehydrogenase